MSDRQFVTTIYDELLVNAGSSMRLRDIRDSLKPEVTALLAKRERDIDREADYFIAEHLQTIRDARSGSLRKDLEYVLDYWRNPENAATVEPILDQAYKLGTATGEDKALRYWTVDDLTLTSMTRHDEAAEVMRAAREFAATVARVVMQMGIDGRTILGDELAAVGAA